MRIESVQASMPSRHVDNAQIVDLIRHHSQPTFEGNLERALAYIGKLLHLSGARSRRWLAEGEKPIDLIRDAVSRALADASMGVNDVDLLIYVGIGKGFLEPGQSYMVAHALEMRRVECFDVIDACMSWSRAMLIAESFLASGRYRRILVVNGEFHTFAGGPLLPDNFCLANLAQLEWTFASYTIGNAAAATLVSADADDPWTWRFASRPDLADLCTIPSFGLGSFSAENDKIGKNGPFRFTSFGKDLHDHAKEPCVRLIGEILGIHPEIRHIFPHASSFKEWDMFAREAGIQDRIHHIYPEYGNLVSASVPAGLALAWQAGLVKRGDRVAGWVGSAGMSFAAYSFHL
jgi:3-oxoacyl-[acyl-carrier-protein] synthase III